MKHISRIIKTFSIIYDIALSIHKKIIYKLKDFFYGRFDLERYYRATVLFKKYTRKIIYPTMVLFIFLSVIYTVISNHFFHVFYPIVFIFLLMISFLLFILRGCLRGEDYKDEYTNDN